MSERVNFSIVIPVKNGANYIEETLKSVFAQSYPHFNLIILENCSDDNTLEIVKSFKDSRLAVVPASQPLGIEDNWARILTLALNEYLVLLCHDDFLEPDFLAEIASLIEAYPEASLYHTHFYFADEHGATQDPCQPVYLQERADEFLGKVHRFKEDFAGSGYVMRSEDFKRVGGYPNYPKLLFSDMSCYFQLSQLAFKVCSPKFLFHFRRHTTSITHLSQTAEFTKAAQRYFEDLQGTSYFRSTENIQISYQFIIEGFVRSNYRKLLYSAIHRRGDRQQILQECLRAKNILIEAYRNDPNFAVRNFPTRVYETINQIPRWALRVSAYRIVHPPLKAVQLLVKQIRLLKRSIALRKRQSL